MQLHAHINIKLGLMPPPNGPGAAAQVPIQLVEEPLDRKYELGNTIGIGSYGKAVLAVRRSDYEKVVVKQILLKGVDQAAKQEALKEALLLAQFDHVNIIHYYESVLEDQCLNIVMEYASEGDLAGVISQRAQEKKFFAEEDIMMWFVQIVLALFHVHSKNVLHRDLKSQNVFISTGNILKLGDFGIARVLSSDTELARTVVGTPYYLSPELCEDKPYNRKSDVWALGCILYELCTLRRAFTGHSLPALVVQILRGKYPPVPTRYSSALRSLVESMLQVNPKDRPSADAILRSSFVRRHVERYAQHVMQLSPVHVPELVPSGFTPPAAEPRSKLSSSPARPPVAATPVRSQPPPARLPRTNSASKAAAPVPPAAGKPAAASPSQAQGNDADKGGDADVGPSSVAGGAAKAGAGKEAAGQAGGRLSGTGWVRQQEAALNELQGAFMLQGLGQHRRGRASPDVGTPGAKVGAGSSAAAAQQGEVAAQEAMAVPEQAASEAGPGADGTDMVVGVQGMGQPAANEPLLKGPGTRAGGSVQVGASGATSKARLLDARQAARAAELEAARLAVVQERARKAQAAAKRSEVSDKAVKQRSAERQTEKERQLAEIKAREVEKAARAADLAAQLKSKQDCKQKLQDQLAAHLAAHQQQVKAAKARVSRAELAQLGAKFAARQLASPAAASPEVAGAAASPFLVMLDAPSPAPGSARKATPGKQPASSPPAKQAGALPSRAAAVQKEAAAEPPWRAAKKAGLCSNTPPGGAGGVFPDVQIYTPYVGREVGTPEPAPAAPRSRPSSRNTPADGGAAAAAVAGSSTPAAAGRAVQQSDDVGGAALGSSELLGLLSELAEVLAGSSSGDEDEGDGEGGCKRSAGAGQGGGGAGGGGGGGREDKPGKHHVLTLPPEKEDKQLPASSHHQRMEQLRLSLEKELGQPAFVAAYNHLKDMQQGAERGDPSVLMVDQQDQEQLKRLLGGKLHLAWQLHRLIKWEDNIFK